MKSPNKKILYAGAAVLIAVLGSTAAAALTVAHLSRTDGRAAELTISQVEGLLPGIAVTSVNCEALAGLCEVIAGERIFYVDPRRGYAYTGSIYDLEAREDVTARRREADVGFANLLAGDAQVRNGGPDRVAGGQGAQPPAVPPGRGGEAVASVEVTLPVENAVVHNGGQGLPVLHVFSDLTCPYCQRLHNELVRATDIEVREYYVDWLGRGGGARAALVLCAEDRSQAADDMYASGTVSVSREQAECAAEYGPVIAANTSFASSFGMRGTPTMVFEDGRRLPGGYMPLEQITAFINSES